MPSNSILEDGEMINSVEDFNKVVERMRSEGSNGLLKAELFTPKDAARFLMANLLGRGNYLDTMHFMECDKFLADIDKNSPLCSGHECNNKMNSHSDVGTIVIMHGRCDRPKTVVVAGICDPCWKKRFDEDKERALSGFLEWLGMALPDMGDL